MKKVLFILFMFISLGLTAQEIIDYGGSIKITYENGFTTTIKKSNIIEVTKNKYVGIIVGLRDNVKTETQTHYLKYNEFDYPSIDSLYDVLSAICVNRYTEVYSYDNGNLDTVSYYHGSNLQYQVVYGYTNALVTSKTIITP